MIVFPFLVGLLALVVVALVLASAPGRIRTVRSRGAEPFVYPPTLTIALITVALLVVFIGWLLVLGPAD